MGGAQVIEIGIANYFFQQIMWVLGNLVASIQPFIASISVPETDDLPEIYLQPLHLLFMICSFYCITRDHAARPSDDNKIIPLIQLIMMGNLPGIRLLQIPCASGCDKEITQVRMIKGISGVMLNFIEQFAVVHIYLLL